MRPVGMTPIQDAGLPDLGTSTGADAETRDAAAPDASAPDAAIDAGVMIEPCGEIGAVCNQPSNCATPNAAPTACETCPPYHRSPCISESCNGNPPLDIGDVYEVSFIVEATVPRIRSMSWMAVARETPSGIEISCADVYAGNVDFSNACYNVLDVRYREITQSGDSYALLLGTFTSGLPTLFIVSGFEEARARGQPAGISCTEYQVGSPGTGVVRFEGGTMRPLP